MGKLVTPFVFAKGFIGGFLGLFVGLKGFQFLGYELRPVEGTFISH